MPIKEDNFEIKQNEQVKKDGVVINTVATYLDEQSEPYYNMYLWIYNMKITNSNNNIIQLIRRYWEVTDAYGIKIKFEDTGYYDGHAPIKTKETIEYSSILLLNSPSGVVEGYHEFIDEISGTIYHSKINTFSLDSPYNLQKKM